MNKWRKVNLPGGNSPDWVALENVNDRRQIRFLETVVGKKKRYEAELKSGYSEYSIAMGDRYPDHKLSGEEKAYRKGWLSAFREQERMKGGAKKR